MISIAIEKRLKCQREKKQNYTDCVKNEIGVLLTFPFLLQYFFYDYLNIFIKQHLPDDKAVRSSDFLFSEY